MFMLLVRQKKSVGGNGSRHPTIFSRNRSLGAKLRESRIPAVTMRYEKL
jgi:hypothetical protein